MYSEPFLKLLVMVKRESVFVLSQKMKLGYSVRIVSLIVEENLNISHTVNIPRKDGKIVIEVQIEGSVDLSSLKKKFEEETATGVMFLNDSEFMLERALELRYLQLQMGINFTFVKHLS